MANIKFGAVITDSRGSIGGHTFKATRYGPIMTHHAFPPKRDSGKRSRINANFSALTKRWWSELDASQRTAWRDLAAANPITNRWGDEYALTGLAFYVKLNQRLFTAGLTQTDDAPSDQTVASLLTATLAISAPSTATLTFTTSPVVTDHILYLFGTRGLSPATENFAGKFFFLLASAPSTTSPLSISSAWLSQIGQLISGRGYALGAALLNTTNAALSPFIEAQTIAT
jgi:hypothetical protein